MGNLPKVKSAYTNTSRIQELKTALASKSQRIQLTGLLGSSESFVTSEITAAVGGFHMFIAEDKEQAAFLQNDISNIHAKKNVYFFPDSFKNPGQFDKIENSNVLLRTETVDKLALSDKVGAVVVTYPEALFEKVVAPKYLDEQRLAIVLEEKLDVDFLIEVFVEYGFERVDFVYSPGQFAIRGGIVDIFSFGNDYPYRVELFDDEVESIRTFDPDTQLSKQTIGKVNIVPNINTQFKQEEKVNLFKLFPADTVIWMKDHQQIVDRLQMCFDKAIDFSFEVEDATPEEIEELKMNFAFITPAEVLTDLKQFKTIELYNSSAFKKEDEVTKFHFETSVQPSFNKNFELLIQNLKENTSAGIENFIFTDSTRQIERFYNIFEDLGAEVMFHPVPTSIHRGFIDKDNKVACYTDHQIFERYYRYKSKGFAKSESINVKLLRELQPGDYVTHMDHGVGKFSGLQKIDINGSNQEAVRLIYQGNDVLYVSINSLHKISKYKGKDGTPPKMHKLGSDTWVNLKRKTKKKVKDIAEKLIKLYAKRKSTPGFAFPEDGYLQNELEASFIYEDTPDQEKATIEVKEDMMKPFPMDRLICGDVGFGKTEIAIRAAFKAVENGKQVAILVPTTILALQHYKTLSSRLGEFGADVDYINRFRTAKEKTAIFERVKEGKIDILIGTHSILNKKVSFKDLGLLVVDEEQKFGVAAKEKLRALSVNVDTLTLTATPIPRTLQFSLLGARDLSIMRTPPPNRQPIQTHVKAFNEEEIKNAILDEVYRGGQVFFVHNRVQSLTDMAALLHRVCPDVDISMAHGQMEAKDLEKTLLDFIDKKFDVLCCTNIIETGLDIPNANTIIINNAHNFGLSDLHQLRGRVGRSNKKAYCYLLSPPLSVLTPEARKRLRTLEEFSELGSGFNIAMRDLDIRGAGNLLGGEQSGFITDIGYETYQKILDEAIQELRDTEFKDLFHTDDKHKQFVRDVQVEIEAEMLLPNRYVDNSQERLLLYHQIDKLKTEEEIQAYIKKLEDRFGPLPVETQNLFEAVRIQWYCKDLGFERLIFKKRKLRCYFVSDPQSAYFESKVFGKVMQYVQDLNKSDLTIKQSNKFLILIHEELRGLEFVKKFLELLHQKVMREIQ